MKNPIYKVSLTGGLGNQLFQLAAALNVFTGENIILTSAYGNPRPLKKPTADLYLFNLPKNVHVEERENANIIVQKGIGYILRMGIEPRNYEKNVLTKFLISNFSKFLLFLDLRKFFHIESGKEVGFCNIEVKNTNTLLVGYFQSYKWLEKEIVLNGIRSISPKRKSKFLNEFVEKAIIDKPLFVHVRLTDYKLEANFGIPSASYYSEAVSRMMEFKNFEHIWLFSDDPEIAISYLPKAYSNIVTIIPEFEDSPAETLELFRNGNGYIIANSSFSWWGAMLAHNQDVKVIAPNPWFRNLPNPIFLLPPTWETLNPW